MNALTHNPIATLRNWHSAAKTEAEKAKSEQAPFGYDEAVKGFQDDVAELKSKDLGPQDPVAPARGLYPYGLAPMGGIGAGFIGTDIDRRPGEVEVPGLGKLHSNDEGFEVVRHSRAGLFGSTTSTYNVNEKDGTITVTNTKTSGSMLSGSKETESYVLDTNSKEVKEYKSDVTAWAPYSGGFIAG